ncbi:8-oxo-dGTP diphosphatase [Neisseria sp. HSC-16F19]|nr:NUDIX domain-containing protein [Neisseria sp. HSC-16F19]MCP2040739.1 8-oxo-dGTP diphosphatase [Neisseria sp. HSC-16F19]
MSNERPLIPVVAAVLYNDKGQFLLSSRPEGKPYAGYWEFAGGKVEPGEGEVAALQRELAEELGISVTRATPWLTAHHHYEHAHVRLRFFRIAAADWHGDVQAKEGQAWAWQHPGDYTVSPMLPANTALLKALAVPTRLSGSLQHGLSAPGWRILPYARGAADCEGMLLNMAEWTALTQRPHCDSLWLILDTADAVNSAAAQDADVWVWPVRDETAAQTALALLEHGVARPLVVAAHADSARLYIPRWLAAGAHTVFIDNDTECV